MEQGSRSELIYHNIIRCGGLFLGSLQLLLVKAGKINWFQHQRRKSAIPGHIGDNTPGKGE